MLENLPLKIIVVHCLTIFVYFLICSLLSRKKKMIPNCGLTHSVTAIDNIRHHGLSEREDMSAYQSNPRIKVTG